jgi:redox-sensitive bicupin YhaK (pirin superfamily)
MVHASLAPGARIVVPWPVNFNALAYVLGSEGAIGAERRPIETGQLAVFGAGDAFTIESSEKQDSRTGTLEVMLLGGVPIREPVASYGPFVMNTNGEIRQAFEDYEAGRLGTVPATELAVPPREASA